MLCLLLFQFLHYHLYEDLLVFQHLLMMILLHHFQELLLIILQYSQSCRIC